MTDILACHKPATVSNRFRALQQFFRYLLDEGEIDHSLADCAGEEFEDRRDEASDPPPGRHRDAPG